jgi:uncharacterized Zn-binding protein involved in type VI secretion
MVFLTVVAVLAGSAAASLSGTRTSAAGETWSGTWAREEVSGNLILTQTGTTVTGHYTWNDGSGTVSGTVSAAGQDFSGSFNETHYKGTFSLTLRGTGTTFTGTYDGINKDTGGSISGPFTGQCIAGPCLQNEAAGAKYPCGTAHVELRARPPTHGPIARYGPIAVYQHIPDLRIVRHGAGWAIVGLRVAHLHDQWREDDCGGVGTITHVAYPQIVNGGRPVATVGDQGHALEAHGCPADPIQVVGIIRTGDPRITVHGRPVAVPGSRMIVVPSCGADVGHVK